MAKIEIMDNVNDYVRYVGAEELHPHVAVIHYDELEHVLIRTSTGDTATHYIRRFVIDRAKSMLVSGKTVTETADSLGFDYPQHFTRAFKNETGLSPSAFLGNIG